MLAYALSEFSIVQEVGESAEVAGHRCLVVQASGSKFDDLVAVVAKPRADSRGQRRVGSSRGVISINDGVQGRWESKPTWPRLGPSGEYTYPRSRRHIG